MNPTQKQFSPDRAGSRGQFPVRGENRLNQERRVRTRLVVGLLALLSLSACETGPGNKPSTMHWKTYADDQPIAFPPSSWVVDGLRYELTRVESTRRYTVLKTTSRGLRFHVSITNAGGRDDKAYQRAPKASLRLSDGTYIERLVWTSSVLKLKPGELATGMYFNDGTLGENVMPTKLEINGRTVAQW